MTRKCSVPSCRSNYDAERERVSTFKFPSDPVLCQKWIKSINRSDFVATKNSCVCIKHFDAKFIVLDDVVERHDGSVLRVKRTYPMLVKGAYPTIFANQPNYLSKALPKECLESDSIPNDQPLEQCVQGGKLTNYRLSRRISPIISNGEIDYKSLTQSVNLSKEYPSCKEDCETKEVKGEPNMEENTSLNLEIEEHKPLPALVDIKEEPKDPEEGETIEPINFVSVCIKEEAEDYKEEPEDEDDLQPLNFVSVEEDSEEVILGGPTFEDLPIDTRHKLSPEEYYGSEGNEDPTYPEVVLGQDTADCGQDVGSASSADADKPFKCDLCVARFKKHWNLKQHRLKHSGAKPYVCDVCGKSFNDCSVLKKHKRIHSGEKPYACTLCEKKFIQKCSLNKHLSFHKEKPINCDLCTKSFASVAKMEYHRRVHTEERPYKCERCGAEFRQSHNLSKHKHIHNRERPYKCEDCDKTFTQSYNLKTHRQVHTGEKPFACCYCEAAFRVKEKLIIHERKHTGERPYPCEVCGKAFSILTSYKVHMKTHSHAKR